MGGIYPGLAWISTADVSVSNTVTETSLLGSGVGSRVIGASEIHPGRVIWFKIAGTIQSILTPTLRIRGKLGSTLVIDTTTATLVVITGTNQFEIEGWITCRTEGATGTIFSQGWLVYHSGLSGFNRIQGLNTTTTTLDTTVSQTLDVTAQWGTISVSNIITQTNAYMDILH